MAVANTTFVRLTDSEKRPFWVNAAHITVFGPRSKVEAEGPVTYVTIEHANDSPSHTYWVYEDWKNILQQLGQGN